MLDGIESRLHIVNTDTDLVRLYLFSHFFLHVSALQAKNGTLSSDAYVVVYSITDRQSFQTAVTLLKQVRESEGSESSPPKRHVPIILVGNKSDLVRKRAVTKESESSPSRK